MLKDLTHQLLELLPLTAEQMTLAVEELIDDALGPELKAGFLVALAKKGETVDEITAVARALRARCVQPVLDSETRSREILDVCGTGGDRLGTFNISTTVALITAAAGVTVAKHGNRAITSQAGSADVLEALGICIDLTPEQAAQSLRDHQFAFFFAPRYHPAFKHIAAARKLCAERGQRTLFNILGPLLNPVSPTAQLVGVPHPALCEPMARVLQLLGVRRGMVVCGAIPGEQGPTEPGLSAQMPSLSYLDELSTLGQNTTAEFYQDRGFSLSISNSLAELQPASLADLKGGDAAANAALIRRILRGEERGPKLDAVLLNAGAALFVAGKARTISDGWALAAETIESGRALRKLEDLVNYMIRLE